MNYYCVCDIDGFTTNDPDVAEAHFLLWPAHTSHFGVGGIDASPTPYAGGSSTISQVTSDPVAPSTGQFWILAEGSVGGAGHAMGVLGLTYSRNEVAAYKLSVKMVNGDVKRMELI